MLRTLLAVVVLGAISIPSASSTEEVMRMRQGDQIMLLGDDHCTSLEAAEMLLAQAKLNPESFGSADCPIGASRSRVVGVHGEDTVCGFGTVQILEITIILRKDTPEIVVDAIPDTVFILWNASIEDVAPCPALTS